MTDKQTFAVTVKSPHGTQAIESFYHHLNKIASEANERWGIEITIEKFNPESVSTEDFE